LRRTSIEERERCYPFVLSRTPDETGIIKYYIIMLTKKLSLDGQHNQQIKIESTMNYIQQQIWFIIQRHTQSGTRTTFIVLSRINTTRVLKHSVAHIAHFHSTLIYESHGQEKRIAPLSFIHGCPTQRGHRKCNSSRAMLSWYFNSNSHTWPTLYPRRGSRCISDILLRHPRYTKIS
jgi:hypothetical protein